MTERIVVVEITRMETVHLAALLTQFLELLEESDGRAGDDPAVARLVPDAYADDADAAAEFRSLTQSDLLDRRTIDARIVLGTLGASTSAVEDAEDAATVVSLALGPVEVSAWLRTLAALRLVLATRLGIQDDDDHDDDDPRFGIYDWIGYRLDGLVQASDD